MKKGNIDIKKNIEDSRNSDFFKLSIAIIELLKGQNYKKARAILKNAKRLLKEKSII